MGVGQSRSGRWPSLQPLRLHLQAGRFPPLPSRLPGCAANQLPRRYSSQVDPSCTAGDCAHELNDNAAGLAKFIKYAVTLPDVYFVTYSDLVGVDGRGGALGGG